MAIEIRVPTLGELITEATVGKWFKKAGEAVRADEPLVELETDKVTLEVNAPGAGVLSEITAATGQTVVDRRAARPARRRRRRCRPRRLRRGRGAEGRARRRAPPMPPAPSAAKIAAEQRIDLSTVAGSGKRGQVLKGDVLAAAAAPAARAPARRSRVRAVAAPAPAPAPAPARRASPPPTTARARSACA